MIAALLLAAAGPQTAVEAERAFAADAQAIGQWTAVRKWAADDAIFLPPQKVANALKDAPDPLKSVEWWPTASFVSCDGATAANTGGALWPGERPSYFSTIWQRQADGAWRWRLDHGADLPAPRARVEPTVRRAACVGKPTDTMADVDVIERGSGGESADGTLRWHWVVAPAGGHSFIVRMWTGEAFETVIDDRVAPPATR